jgi:two-component system sensor histidine kinase MprB
MTFRTRLTLVAAAAVALAVVLASVVVYVVVRGELRETVDEGLQDRAELIASIPLRGIQSPGGRAFLLPPPEFGGPGGYVQAVESDGTTLRSRDADVPLPVSERVLQVAEGSGDEYFSDAHVAGTHLRVLTFPYSNGYAVQVARPLTEVDNALEQIRTFLFLIAAGGIAFAAALGLAVSRAALAPVRRLTEATENVTETGDLSERIAARGRDELSRLAGSFNRMLEALAESVHAQRRLVADASHELRTPVTSLRTNIEVLARGKDLPPEESERLLRDAVVQLEEITTLITDVVELARGAEQNGQPEEIRLDLLVGEAVERAQRHSPDVVFTASLQPSSVEGVESSLGRAVANLLDNAAKWSPSGGSVEVGVQDGQVVVRDYGPGIADEDLPFVFDRFYRSREARARPGSGLGLAIVRQVAEAHGGEIVAERAEGGGTRMRLSLPLLRSS